MIRTDAKEIKLYYFRKFFISKDGQFNTFNLGLILRYVLSPVDRYNFFTFVSGLKMLSKIKVPPVKVFTEVPVTIEPKSFLDRLTMKIFPIPTNPKLKTKAMQTAKGFVEHQIDMLTKEIATDMPKRCKWNFGKRFHQNTKFKMSMSRIKNMTYCCECGKRSIETYKCVERNLPYCDPCLCEYWKNKKMTCDCNDPVFFVHRDSSTRLYEDGSRVRKLYMTCKTRCEQRIAINKKRKNRKTPHMIPELLLGCIYDNKISCGYNDNSSKHAKKKRKTRAYEKSRKLANSTCNNS